jgi:hypothetical protein
VGILVGEGKNKILVDYFFLSRAKREGFVRANATKYRVSITALQWCKAISQLGTQGRLLCTLIVRRRSIASLFIIGYNGGKSVAFLEQIFVQVALRKRVNNDE